MFSNQRRFKDNLAVQLRLFFEPNWCGNRSIIGQCYFGNSQVRIIAQALKIRPETKQWDWRVQVIADP